MDVLLPVVDVSVDFARLENRMMRMKTYHCRWRLRKRASSLSNIFARESRFFLVNGSCGRMAAQPLRPGRKAHRNRTLPRSVSLSEHGDRKIVRCSTNERDEQQPPQELQAQKYLRLWGVVEGTQSTIMDFLKKYFAKNPSEKDLEGVAVDTTDMAVSSLTRTTSKIMISQGDNEEETQDRFSLSRKRSIGSVDPSTPTSTRRDSLIQHIPPHPTTGTRISSAGFTLPVTSTTSSVPKPIPNKRGQQYL